MRLFFSVHTNHDLQNEKHICEQNHTHEMIDERYGNTGYGVSSPDIQN